MRHATRQDAIEQEILPALDNPDDYDVDAICAEAYGWAINQNEAGQELLDTGGFEMVVGVDEFWKIVEKHAKPQQAAELPEIAKIRKGDPVGSSVSGRVIWSGGIATRDAFEVAPGDWCVLVRHHGGAITPVSHGVKVDVPSDVLAALRGAAPESGERHPDLIDVDGDRWFWSEGYGARHYNLFTRAEIAESYGPVRDAD